MATMTRYPPDQDSLNLTQLRGALTGTRFAAHLQHFASVGDVYKRQGSTSSQYLMPMDFTTNQASALIKLPYVPNSMVISQDGSTLYLGSSQALMTVTTLNLSLIHI